MLREFIPGQTCTAVITPRTRGGAETPEDDSCLPGGGTGCPSLTGRAELLYPPPTLHPLPSGCSASVSHVLDMALHPPSLVLAGLRRLKGLEVSPGTGEGS